MSSPSAPSRGLAGAVGGNNSYGGTASDRHLRDVLRPALRDALPAGVAPWQIIQEVADALTGELRGYRSRLVERTLRQAWESVEHVNTEAAKAIEQQEREARA